MTPDEETRWRRDVLLLVLVEHPARLTVAELSARLGAPADVERAVEALIAGDLLLREGDSVIPTPPAIRFHELRSATSGA